MQPRRIFALKKGRSARPGQLAGAHASRGLNYSFCFLRSLGTWIFPLRWLSENDSRAVDYSPNRALNPTCEALAVRRRRTDTDLPLSPSLTVLLFLRPQNHPLCFFSGLLFCSGRIPKTLHHTKNSWKSPGYGKNRS